VPSVLFVEKTEPNSDFAIGKIKAKLRLEVLFKKFHPRINLATLQNPLQERYP
jgi:hypothetical protein